MPFFYLYAHWFSGGVDLPLAQEISLIVASLAEFVICVDDFKHPDPGYGYDRHNDELELSLDNLRPRLSVPTAPTFLYPAAPAKTETGAARHSVYRAGDTLSVNAARRAAAHAGITSALAYLRIEPWPEGK
jgi:hypothetical protein